MDNFINELLNILSKMGFTYNKIHERTGIAKLNLSKWRNGESKPNQDNLLKLRNFTLEVLTENDFNFPLKKEYREPLENFYRYTEEVLQEMPRNNNKEATILSDHADNQEALRFLKPSLDFGLFDSYINFNSRSGFNLDHKRQIERKIKKQYQSMFVLNFNLLIDFIDNNSEKNVKALLCENWTRERAEQFYNNLPHEEDYEELEGISFISSIAEFWLAQELKVSKTQIRNWKIGKDFPTEENLSKLKKLLHLNGKMAFLGYEFPKWQLEGMFLPDIDEKLRKKDEDFLYYETLEFFTQVLFFYCGKSLVIKQLKNDMENSLTEEVQENVVTEFFREFHNLKVVREIIPNEEAYKNLPNLASYLDMSDQQVDYIIRKDETLLSRIFKKEHVDLLKEVSENRCFVEEQKEQLDELVSLLENGKGIKFPYFKFKFLYSPDNHSVEDVEEIAKGLALFLTVPSVFKWFHSDYSFENLSDKESSEVIDFANLALLNNNQELKEKVKRYAVEKLRSNIDLPYCDLLAFFDDLLVPSIVEKIFGKK